jgi:hypothetical protein
MRQEGRGPDTCSGTGTGTGAGTGNADPIAVSNSFVDPIGRKVVSPPG